MAHTIEVAKSGRASCRTCHKNIDKGLLRFGEEAPNAFADPGSGATSYRWHHLACAATKLSHELRPLLAAYDGEVPDRAELERLMSEADANRPPPFPYADRAPTARARCQECGEGIAKGALRVAFEREVERGMTMSKAAGYLHPACAAGHMEAKGVNHEALTELLRKNTKLSDDDKDLLFSEV